MAPAIAQNPSNMKNDDPQYEKAWAEISALEKQGLYKSGLEKTEALLELLVKANNSPQILKAIVFKAKFLKYLNEDGSETAIDFIRKETEAAGFPRKAILQSLLGELYADYLREQRWEIQDRTNLAGGSQSGDIKTWTAADFEEAIAKAYLASVQEPRMATILLKDYEAILSSGKNTKGIWTSLQDLLLHRALEHFSHSTSALTSPVYRFYLDQAEAFADTRAFVDYRFDAKDDKSNEYQALLLFQSWLRQKLANEKASSLVDADLMRIEFVHDKSVRQDKDTLYEKALRNIESLYHQEPGIAMAM